MSWEAEAILTGRPLCLCGRGEPKRLGDPIALGDVVGFSIEPYMRYGRVVGLIKDLSGYESLKAASVVIREFRPGDGRWPTGQYARHWLVVAWDHPHPTYELTESQEPIDWELPMFTPPAKRAPTADQQAMRLPRRIRHRRERR